MKKAHKERFRSLDNTERKPRLSKRNSIESVGQKSENYKTMNIKGTQSVLSNRYNDNLFPSIREQAGLRK